MMRIKKMIYPVMIIMAAVALMMTLSACGGGDLKADNLKGTWIADSQYNPFQNNNVHYRAVIKEDGTIIMEQYDSQTATAPVAAINETYALNGGNLTLKAVDAAPFVDIPDGDYQAALKGDSLTLTNGDHTLIFVKMSAN